MNLSRRGFLGGGAAFFVAGCRTAEWFGAPELKFGVVSDIHVTTPQSTRLFRVALEYFRRRGADAVMVPGDLTDWGIRSGYRYVADAWNDVFGGTGTVPLFCTGNHDFDGWRYADMTMEMHANGYSEEDHITNFGQKKCWEEFFGEPYAPVRLRTVKGYDFVSAEWRGFDRLPEFMKDHGGRFRGKRPFFVFQHPPMKGTTSDSAGWADNGHGFKALRDYPNAIAFTGHTHRPFIDERLLWQGEFTAIATPSLSYADTPRVYENATGGKSQTMPPLPLRRDLRGGQGYFVSVYPERMVVERIDFDEDCEEAAPAWVVPFGGDGAAEQHLRESLSRAPRFPAGASVATETRNTHRRDGSWAIALNCEFPAAVPADGERVLDYEIRAVPRDGSKPLVKRFISPAYAHHPRHEPSRMRFWFDVRELPQAKEYVLEARARNSFGKVSKPIFSRVWKGEAGLERVMRTCLVLTFDDGPKGHLTVAAPVLEKYGFTGCFNIVTDWIGRPGKLTWDDVRELSRRGHEIASHGKSHVDMVKLMKERGPEAVRKEVELSRDAIAEALGRAPTLFCHPYMAHDAAVDAIIRECGMVPYFGPRCNTGSDMAPAQFAARLDSMVKNREGNMDMLFHGVSRDTGGWSPVATAEDFESMVKSIAERKSRDVVEVVTYEKYVKWFARP